MLGSSEHSVRKVSEITLTHGIKKSGTGSTPFPIDGSLQQLKMSILSTLPDIVRETARYVLYTKSFLNSYSSKEPHQVCVVNEWFDICQVAGYDKVLPHNKYVLFKVTGAV